MKRGTLRGWIILLVLFSVYITLILWEPGWEKALKTLFPKETVHLYARSSLARLVAEHVLLVFAASGMATIAGVAAGIFVTREAGRPFRPAADDLSSIGQTFPPVAVLALAVPVTGFGFKPAVLALFLYGVMPVLRNTITGLESVSEETKDAALGMGMRPWQLLLQVELPLALRVIMGGVRITTVINIGTATIAATIGAGGLGAPIVSGLIGHNPAVILEGAVAAALLALLADAVLGQLEQTLGWNATE
ncbi:MAG: ABC transporter permease [Thermovirgaceae bacterium]